jgi:large subunit ribosomal protein L29
MRAEDLRGKSKEELAEELLGLRREQFNLRMQRGTGELAKHTEYGRVKKDIARVKTVMSELRLGAKAQKSDSGKSE